LAKSVPAVAGGAGVDEHLRTIAQIGRAARLFYALHAGPDELGAIRNPSRQPFHVSKICLHLRRIERHGVAVHAALQATVDAVFQRVNLGFARAILRELAPHTRQRHRVGLGAGLEVTALTGEATAREALGWIARCRTDLVWGISK